MVDIFKTIHKQVFLSFNISFEDNLESQNCASFVSLSLKKKRCTTLLVL